MASYSLECAYDAKMPHSTSSNLADSSLSVTQELLHLTHENMKILQKLREVQPQYSAAVLEDQFVESTLLSERLSQFRGDTSARFHSPGIHYVSVESLARQIAQSQSATRTKALQRIASLRSGSTAEILAPSGGLVGPHGHASAVPGTWAHPQRNEPKRASTATERSYGTLPRPSSAPGGDYNQVGFATQGLGSTRPRSAHRSRLAIGAALDGPVSALLGLDSEHQQHSEPASARCMQSPILDSAGELMEPMEDEADADPLEVTRAGGNQQLPGMGGVGLYADALLQHNADPITVVDVLGHGVVADDLTNKVQDSLQAGGTSQSHDQEPAESLTDASANQHLRRAPTISETDCLTDVGMESCLHNYDASTHADPAPMLQLPLTGLLDGRTQFICQPLVSPQHSDLQYEDGPQIEHYEQYYKDLYEEQLMPVHTLETIPEGKSVVFDDVQPTLHQSLLVHSTLDSYAYNASSALLQSSGSLRSTADSAQCQAQCQIGSQPQHWQGKERDVGATSDETRYESTSVDAVLEELYGCSSVDAQEDRTADSGTDLRRFGALHVSKEHLHGEAYATDEKPTFGDERDQNSKLAFSLLAEQSDGWADHTHHSGSLPLPAGMQSATERRDASRQLGGPSMEQSNLYPRQQPNQSRKQTEDGDSMAADTYTDDYSDVVDDVANTGREDVGALDRRFDENRQLQQCEEYDADSGHSLSQDDLPEELSGFSLGS